MARQNLLDPKVRAAKKRKQAIVLGVLFVAVLAFQGPRTMKMLNPPAPESTASTESVSTTSTSTTATAGAVASAGTAQAVAATTDDAEVVNADLAPAPLEGQLADFTAFDAKDPFVQQKVAKPEHLNNTTSSSSSSKATGTTTAAKTSRGAVVVETPTKTSEPALNTGTGTPSTATPTAPTTQSPTAPAASPTGATISINGVKESVNVGSDFPTAAPLFRLVKLNAKSAEISIAGGSLASGDPTVKLELNKPLTLMNTADGTRYVVILVSTTATPAASTSTPTP